MSDMDGLIADAENDGLLDRLAEESERIRKLLGVDTIQIFATVMKSGGDTLRVQSGSGNWFARYGQCREWIVREEGKAARE